MNTTNQPLTFNPDFDPAAPVDVTPELYNPNERVSFGNTLPCDVPDSDSMPQSVRDSFVDVELGEPIENHPNFTIISTDQTVTKSGLQIKHTIRCSRCGTDRVVSANRLMNPSPLRCTSCTNTFLRLAKPGFKAGKLTVIKPMDEHGFITFKCDCGRTYRTRNIHRLVFYGTFECKYCSNSAARIKNITNVRFGHLTAVSFVRSVGNESVWKFRCDCGNLVNLPLNDVKFKKNPTCGNCNVQFDPATFDPLANKFAVDYKPSDYQPSDYQSGDNHE